MFITIFEVAELVSILDCAHQYLKLFRMTRGKVVLLSQDGLKAILPVLIDRYGILHDQDDTEDQGVGAC